MRPVVGPQVGDSQAFHTGTAELRLSVDKSNLLIKSHAAERILHPLLQRTALVEIHWQDGSLYCGHTKQCYYSEYKFLHTR